MEKKIVRASTVKFDFTYPMTTKMVVFLKRNVIDFVKKWMDLSNFLKHF